jgi:hypothetical protein
MKAVVIASSKIPAVKNDGNDRAILVQGDEGSPFG